MVGLRWACLFAIGLGACDCGGDSPPGDGGGGGGDAGTLDAAPSDGGDSGPAGDGGMPPNSDLPASVSAGIDATSTTPGTTLPVRWTLDGDLRGLELQVALRAPGPITSAWSRFLQGVTPPTGTVRWLGPAGAWTDTEASLPATTGMADTPALDLPGEWRLIVLLRDPVTRAIAAYDSQTFVVSATPAIRLSLNRRIASTLDEVRAVLDLVPGEMPRDVRILAYVEIDGDPFTVRDGALPGPTIVYEGPAAALSFGLLGGPLPAEGYPQLHVRLLDAGNGEVLGMAFAALEVCDSQTTIEGHVDTPVDPPAGSPLLGEGRVVPYDLVEQRAGEPVAIDAMTGEFTLPLAPGHWVLALEGTAPDGAPLQAMSEALEIRGACQDATESMFFDLEPAPVSSTTSRRSSGRRPGGWAHVTRTDLAPDMLPIVDVKVRVTNDMGPDRSIVMDAFTGELDNRMGRGINVLDEQTATRFLDFIALSQALGGDPGSEWMGRIFGVDFVFTLDIDDETPDRILTGTLVDFRHLRPGEVLHRTAMTIGPRDTEVTLPQVRAIVDELQRMASVVPTDPMNDWMRWFRRNQFRPLIPKLEVTTMPHSVRVGESITFTASLQDVDGYRVPDREIEVLVQHPSEHIESFRRVGTCTTRMDGTCTLSWTATAPAVDNAGHVRVQYRRPGGSLEGPVESYFLIEAIAGIRMRSINVMMYPGDDNNIRAIVSRDGMPVGAGQVVRFAAMRGMVSPATNTTDASGETYTRFTAGPTPGAAPVTAMATVMGTEAQGVFNGVIVPRFAVELRPEATRVTGGGRVRIAGRVRSGGTGAGIGGVLVRLGLDSPGTIDPTSVLTDPGGAFVVTFTAPPTGSGFANITATATFPEERDASATATIEYEDPSGTMPRPMYGGTWVGTWTDSFHCDLFECGGRPGCVRPVTPMGTTQFIVRDPGDGSVRVEWEVVAPTAMTAGSIQIYEGRMTADRFAAVLQYYAERLGGPERPAGLRDESFSALSGVGPNVFQARAPCHTYDFMVSRM